jgi:hypothetical protein
MCLHTQSIIIFQVIIVCFTTERLRSPKLHNRHWLINQGSMCTFPSFAETIGGFPKGALLHSRFKDNILSLVKNHMRLSTSCAHVYLVYNIYCQLRKFVYLQKDHSRVRRSHNNLPPVLHWSCCLMCQYIGGTSHCRCFPCSVVSKQTFINSKEQTRKTMQGNMI